MNITFINPTLEALAEKLRAHREQLINHMVYVKTSEINTIAESRGMLCCYDNVLEALVELDKELNKKDSAI